MIILEENFKWHLEAFASELFIYSAHLFTAEMTVRKDNDNTMRDGV